ncbi:DHA2 family efflux MFS transporter permease subunit [Fusobacterium sp.]|uniref:DHA2 family efflux MFS transporter permease subunit n=1 Tax=Fusobacterium sp. TaxID=68766 RepID=UPI002634C8EE|nr:DHA2 family efflux MFS transporter permease subunit [Fusobacterium sp.]
MGVSLEVILVTLALSIGSFMNVLDSTIVNVSLSHIAGDFAVAPTQGTWVITSYGVSEAIFLPLIGWLTKRFGIVRQYIFATLFFTIASVLCGISFSFGFLLFARVLQGVVGASMIPLSQTLMMGFYPKDKKAIALGIWSMTIILAPVLGPVIGGWITDSFSWRGCFYINVPFGILSTYVVYYIFKKKGYKDKVEKPPIDILGLIFLTIGISSLQIMLDKGNDLDWFSSELIIVLAILSFVFLSLLVIWEWYHKNPMINIKLFLNRNFTVGALSISIGTAAFFASVVVIPLWLQNYMGYTAFKSGLATSTLGIAIMIIAPILGTQLNKLDARKVVVFGFFSFTLSSFFTGNYTPEVTAEYIAFSRFLSGIGLGFFFLPLNTITLSEIADEDMAGASGVYNFMRNIGNSFGTSLSVNYWNHRMAFHHQELAEATNTGNPNFLSYIHNTAGMMQNKLLVINNIITEQAAIMGVNDIIICSGILILFLIPLVMFARKINR